VTRILVPYHLTEHLPNLDVPVPADRTVTADLPPDDPWAAMATLYDRVAGIVAEAVAAGDRPTVVSADCTTSLGTVAGLQRAGIDPAIVWFDGHGDVQTLETTASGYLGGFPLRILVGYRPELIADALRLRPVPEDRAVLVDARDLDPPEVEYLDRSAIRRCDVDDVVVPDGPIYLHVDLDVVNPADLPGLRFPAMGGPSLRAVGAAVEDVLATGRVVAVGLGCTWYPGRGAADAVRGAAAIAAL